MNDCAVRGMPYSEKALSVRRGAPYLPFVACRVPWPNRESRVIE
jgi:hypothetical protein